MDRLIIIVLLNIVVEEYKRIFENNNILGSFKLVRS